MYYKKENIIKLKCKKYHKRNNHTKISYNIHNKYILGAVSIKFDVAFKTT